MKDKVKRIVVLLAVLTAGLVAFAQLRATTEDGRAVLLRSDGTWSYADSVRADTSFDFRRVRWGMSGAEVRAAEEGTLVKEGEDALVYDAELATLPCQITYVFAANRLAAARIRVTAKHDDENAFLADYKGLKDLLTGKYGKPESAKTRWLNERYKGKPQHWGLAVSLGEMIQHARWNAPRTDVELRLAGGGFKVDLTLVYAGRALQAELDAAEKARLMKGF